MRELGACVRGLVCERLPSVLMVWLLGLRRKVSSPARKLKLLADDDERKLRAELERRNAELEREVVVLNARLRAIEALRDR